MDYGMKYIIFLCIYTIIVSSSLIIGQGNSSCGNNNPVIVSCQEGHQLSNPIVYLRFLTTHETTRCMCNVDGSRKEVIRVQLLRLRTSPPPWSISITAGNNSTITAFSPNENPVYKFNTEPGIITKFDMRGYNGTDICMQLKYDIAPDSKTINITCAKGFRDNFSSFTPVLTTTQSTSVPIKAGTGIQVCMNSQVASNDVIIHLDKLAGFGECYCSARGSKLGNVTVTIKNPSSTCGWTMQLKSDTTKRYSFDCKNISTTQIHVYEWQQFSLEFLRNPKMKTGLLNDSVALISYVEDQNHKTSNISAHCYQGSVLLPSTSTVTTTTSPGLTSTSKITTYRSDIAGHTIKFGGQDNSPCGTNTPVINSCQQEQSPPMSTIFLRFQTTDEQKRCICHVNGSKDKQIRVELLKIKPKQKSSWSIFITDSYDYTVKALSPLHHWEFKFRAKQWISSKFDMRGSQIDVCVRLEYDALTRGSNISITCEEGLRDELTAFLSIPMTTQTTSITVKPGSNVFPEENNDTTQSSDISKTFTRPPNNIDLTQLLIGVSIGILVLLIILIVGFICKKQKRKQEVKAPMEEPFIYGMRDNVLYGTTGDKQDEEPFVYGMRENTLYEGFDQCVDKMDATTQSNDQNKNIKEVTHGDQQMLSESHTEDGSLGVNVYSEVRQSQVVTESSAQPRVELSTEDRNTVNDVYSEVHKVK